MNKNKIYIEHILGAIDEIDSFVAGFDFETFLNSSLVQSAVIRQIEIIGEAVKNLDDEMKEQYTEVRWREIAGTRDKLIHGYFSVDLELVWNIVEKSLPELRIQMTKILVLM